MPKKVKAPVEGKYEPKPRLYLYSGTIKIPEAIKGKLGKILNLLIKTKVVSQHLTQEVGEKRRESYDLDILQIKSPSKLGKVLRS